MPRKHSRYGYARSAYARKKAARKGVTKYQKKKRKAKLRKTRIWNPNDAFQVQYGSGSLMSGFVPDKTVVNLTYTDQISLAAPVTPGTPSFYQYQANGLYDTDTNIGVGHQPFGFDQLMNMYERYRVLSSKITVSVVGSGDNSTAEIAIIGIYRNASISLPGASGFSNILNTMVEDGNSNSLVTSQAAEGTVKSVSNNFYINRDLPFKRDTLESTGTNSANPVSTFYYTIFMGSAQAITSARNAVVTIDFVAEFSQEYTLSGS